MSVFPFWHGLDRIVLYRSIHPSIHLSIQLSIHRSIHLSIHLSVQLSIHRSIHLSIHLSVQLSIQLSIHLSVHLCINDCVNMQLHAETKERDIVNLEAKVGQLEHVRQLQADQLYKLQESRDNVGEKQMETIHRLTEEVNRLKFTLNDLTRRQQEVYNYSSSSSSSSPSSVLHPLTVCPNFAQAHLTHIYFSAPPTAVIRSPK